MKGNSANKRTDGAGESGRGAQSGVGTMSKRRLQT